MRTVALVVGLVSLAASARAESFRSPAELAATVAQRKSACTDGDPRSCRTLALLAEERPSVGIAHSQQVAYLAKACRAGVVDACADWGRLLRYGPSEDRDFSRIGELWSASCGAGSELGCRWLASAVGHGELDGKRVKASKTVQLQAAFIALTIDVSRARQLARPLLGDHQLADQARLLLACADVAEERWDAAIAKADGRKGGDAAFAVVGALARERKAHADEPWTTSYVRAWAESGRPDLRLSMLAQWTSIEPPRPVDPLDESDLAKLLVEYDRWKQFLDAWPKGWPEPLPETLVAKAVALADSKDEATLLLALTVLRSAGVPPAWHERANTARTKMVEALVWGDPQNLARALLAFVVRGPSTGPFTETELTTLQQLSALPQYQSFFPDAFSSYWSVLGAEDDPSSAGLATAAATDVVPPGIAWKLVERAKLTRDHIPADAWNRLVTALHAIGAKMRGGGTLLELAMGNQLLSFENETDATTEARRKDFAALQEHWGSETEDGLWLWPIPALRIDALSSHASGEVHFIESLNALLHDESAKHQVSGK